jgi:hypothetical protein
VRALLIDDLYGLKMGHEPGQVLKIAPEAVQLLRRFRDRNGPAHLKRALLPAETFAAKGVHGSDARNDGGGGGQTCASGFPAGQGRAQQRQVHHVTADARPDPSPGFNLGKKANAAGDLANTDGGQERPMISNADETAHSAWRKNLCQAKADAEPAQSACQSLTTGCVAIISHVVSSLSTIEARPLRPGG